MSYSDRPNDKPKEGCECANWSQLGKLGIRNQDAVNRKFLHGQAPDSDSCARPPNDPDSKNGSWCYCKEPVNGSDWQHCTTGDKSSIQYYQDENGNVSPYYKTQNGKYLKTTDPLPSCLKDSNKAIRQCPEGSIPGFGNSCEKGDGIVYDSQAKKNVCPNTSCWNSNDDSCNKPNYPSIENQINDGNVANFDCSWLTNHCATDQYGCVQDSSGKFSQNQSNLVSSAPFTPFTDINNFAKADTISKKVQPGSVAYKINNNFSSSGATDCRKHGFIVDGQRCVKPVVKCISTGVEYAVPGITPNFQEYIKNGYNSTQQCFDGNRKMVDGLLDYANPNTQDPIPNILFSVEDYGIYCIRPNTNPDTTNAADYGTQDVIKDKTISKIITTVPNFYWLKIDNDMAVIPKTGLNSIGKMLSSPVIVDNILDADGSYYDDSQGSPDPKTKLHTGLFDFEGGTFKKGAWVIEITNRSIPNVSFSIAFKTADGSSYIQNRNSTPLSPDHITVSDPGGNPSNSGFIQISAKNKTGVFAARFPDSATTFIPEVSETNQIAIFQMETIDSPSLQPVKALSGISSDLGKSIIIPNNWYSGRILSSDQDYLYIRGFFPKSMSRIWKQKMRHSPINWNNYGVIYQYNPRSGQHGLISSNFGFADFDASGSDMIFAYDRVDYRTVTKYQNIPNQGDGLVYFAKKPDGPGEVQWQELTILGSHNLFDMDKIPGGFQGKLLSISIDYQAVQFQEEPDLSFGSLIKQAMGRVSSQPQFSFDTLQKRYKYGPKYLLKSLNSILAKTHLDPSDTADPIKIQNRRQKPLTSTDDYANQDLETLLPITKSSSSSGGSRGSGDQEKVVFSDLSGNTLPDACFIVVPIASNMISLDDTFNYENYKVYFKYGNEKICLPPNVASIWWWPPMPNMQCKKDSNYYENHWDNECAALKALTFENIEDNLFAQDHVQFQFTLNSPRLQKLSGMSSNIIKVGTFLPSSIRPVWQTVDSIDKHLVYFLEPGVQVGSFTLAKILCDGSGSPPNGGKHRLPKLFSDGQQNFVSLATFFSLITISGTNLDEVVRHELPPDAPNPTYLYKEKTSQSPGDMTPLEYNKTLYNTASEALNNIDFQRDNSLKFDIFTKRITKDENTINTRNQIVQFLTKTITENDKNIKELDKQIYDHQRLGDMSFESGEHKDVLLFLLRTTLNYCLVVAIIFVLKMLFKETFVAKHIQHIIIIITIIFAIVIGLNIYSIRNRSNRRWALRNWKPGKEVPIIHSNSTNGETEDTYQSDVKENKTSVSDQIDGTQVDGQIDENDPRKKYCTPGDQKRAEKKLEREINKDIRKVKSRIKKYKRELKKTESDEKRLEKLEHQQQEKIKKLKGEHDKKDK